MKRRRVSRREFIQSGAAASTLLAACSLPARDPKTPSITETCDTGRTFRNWARTISCKPARYCQPGSVDEVVQTVKDALAAGKHVRTVGAGHSWSPLVLTNDVLVNLDRLQGVRIDAATLTATMDAGIRLKNLTPALAKQGLGMANLGSIREQSIAGATATGTHGTGLRLGNLSTQIIAMKLVTGTGDVLTIRNSDRELLQAARVSLGALGIVTEVTIQCVKDYSLEYSQYACRFDDLLPKLDTLVQQNERLRLWWVVPLIGPRDLVIVSTMNPPGSAPGILGESLSTGSAVSTGKGSALPMDTQKLINAAPAASVGCPRLRHSTTNYVDALTVPLLPVFHRECEYAIPVANATEALQTFRRSLQEGDLSMTLPLEVRWVAKDDSLLSASRGKDVCYIGISTQENAIEVFQRFEPIMKRLGGRPHWGKCFTLTREEVQAMYPDSYDTFRRIRNELDPKRVFANDLVQRLFD